MVDVCIYNPSGFDGQPDERNITLEPGTYIFGSDLDADIVLLDNGVLPRHFALYVSDGHGVMFELLPDIQQGVDEASYFEKDLSERLMWWHEGSELKVGEVTITLSDLPTSKMPAALPPKKLEAVPKQILATVFVGIGVIITAMFVPQDSVDFESIKKSQLIVSPAESRNTLSRQSFEMLVDRKTPRDILLSEGVVVEKQTETADGWQVTAYVKNSAIKDRANSILSMYPIPVKAQIYSEDTMRKAVSLIANAMEVPITISSLSNGNLVLDGILSEDEKATRLKNEILSDVYGVNSIRFTHKNLVDTKNLIKQIQGIWAGENPYIARSDGSLILPGQYLMNGVMLLDIEYNAIWVETNNQRKKIYLSD